jgi:hypothetical protein
MNVLKIQQELLKQLIANPSQITYSIDEEARCSITTAGGTTFVIPGDKLQISLKDAQLGTDPLYWAEDVAGDPKNTLLPTDEYRHGGTARRYIQCRKPDSAIYVDQGKLKVFDNPQLWQDPEHPYNPIVVTEQFIGDSSPVTVGIVFPTKVDG